MWTPSEAGRCKTLSLSVAVDPVCQPEVGVTVHKNAAMTRMVITGRLIKTSETSIAIQQVFFSGIEPEKE